MSNRLTSSKALLSPRGRMLLEEGLDRTRKNADRLFAGLFGLQYLFVVAMALIVTPRTWIGAESEIHVHVWGATILGAVIGSVPICLAVLHPGAALTRHVIAVAQMLFSALLIHVTGGRIETHFHIFGSLAFLAFYRDYKVLATASVVVAVDHFLRGVYWPQSVFGVLTASPYRWLEHAGWVLFEIIFLAMLCHQSLRNISLSAEHTAELERAKERVEEQVRVRTRQLAEERLREESTRRELETLVNASTRVAIIATDKSGGVTTFNPGAERLLGYTAKEVVGKRTPAIWHCEAEMARRAKELSARLGEEVSGFDVFVRLVQEGGSDEREWTFIRNDGSRVPVDLRITSIRDSKGEISGYLGMATDISIRRQQELALQHAANELQASQEKLRATIRSINDLIFVLDQEGKFIEYHVPHDSQSSASATDFLETHFTESLPPDMAAQLHRAIELAVASASVQHFDYSVAAGSQSRWFNASVSARFDHDGNFSGTTVVARDITHRKQQEEEIQLALEAAERSNRLMEGRESRIVELKDAVNALRTELGWPLKYAGSEPTEQTLAALAELCEVESDERLKVPRAFSEEVTLDRQVSNRIAEIESSRLNAISIAEDAEAARRETDAARRHVEALNKQLADNVAYAESLCAAAEAANLSKSEFLANMSHEIRTPMTAILGFAETLAHNVTGDENIEAVATIRRNGEHLLEIINGILDLSKVESGQLVMERVKHNPAQIIAEVNSLMRVKAIGKGISLDTEFLGEIPEAITTDPTRLRQILINLIGNAIKFTEVGGVKLITRYLQQDANPTLQFDVVDTGIGMTEDEVTALFRPFSQADSSTTRRFGGTGLGLTISKRFAEMLGGNLSVTHTQRDEGSCFRLTVEAGPLEDVKLTTPVLSVSNKQRKSKAMALVDLSDYRLLLAEDGPDNQRLISFVLKKAGADVALVENGQAAVEAAIIAQEEGRPFDCILMDMQMPVMDGYRATQSLREMGYEWPIVALTAHAMDSDRKKCLEAGCDDYDTKPIDRGRLLEKVAKWAARQAPCVS